MRKLIYSMGVSLDGFTAGPEGDIDWSAPDAELHRFHNDQARQLGAHLCGRRLYEDMLSCMEDVVAALQASGAPDDVIQTLQADGPRRVHRAQRGPQRAVDGDPSAAAQLAAPKPTRCSSREVRT